MGTALTGGLPMTGEVDRLGNARRKGPDRLLGPGGPSEASVYPNTDTVGISIEEVVLKKLASSEMS